MRRLRRGLAFVSLACGVAACALALEGTGPAPPTPAADVTTERFVPPVSPPDARTSDGAAPDGAPSDGGLDAPVDAEDLDAAIAACVAVCPDGSACEGGTCNFDCSGQNACQGSRVTCPPGIPCHVTCGETACNQAVSCGDASRCAIDCVGNNACQGGRVTCGGSECTVACTGATTCNQAVQCNATARCSISCSGSDACQGGVVSCTGQTCSVACDGSTSCNQSVVSYADATTIVCSATSSCQGAKVRCYGSTCSVACTGSSSCNQQACCDAATCNLTGTTNVCP